MKNVNRAFAQTKRIFCQLFLTAILTGVLALGDHGERSGHGQTREIGGRNAHGNTSTGETGGRNTTTETGGRGNALNSGMVVNPSGNNAGFSNPTKFGYAE